jgi:stage V sporulation protein D (sporulation-specific penicillin-binding protein)
VARSATSTGGRSRNGAGPRARACRARTSASRIDAASRLALEQELLAAWIADKAKSVSAVVLDPYTGEVYAEATYPSYDANDYGRSRRALPERFIDPNVSHVYEPGSVFKMMTAAAALETGTVRR